MTSQTFLKSCASWEALLNLPTVTLMIQIQLLLIQCVACFQEPQLALEVKLQPPLPGVVERRSLQLVEAWAAPALRLVANHLQIH